MREPSTSPATAPPDVAAGRGAGLAAVVLALTMFSWGFILVKAIDLPLPVLALLRLAIGSLTLAAVAAALRVPWPHDLRLVALAGLAFALHQLLLIESIKSTSIAIVTLVASSQPLLIAAVSRRTVGEVVPRAVFGYAALAVAGVAIVVHANVDDVSRSLYGDVLSVLNVGAFTLYFLLAKRARVGGAPTLTFTAGFLGMAMLCFVPVVLATGVVAPTAPQWGLLAVLALGPGSGHLLINWAHPRVPVALTSLVLAALPLLSGVWAALVLGEPYTWRHVVGMALVVVAIDGGRRAS